MILFLGCNVNADCPYICSRYNLLIEFPFFLFLNFADDSMELSLLIYLIFHDMN